VLQGVVEAQEKEHGENAIKFDRDFAQMEFDLMAAKDQLRHEREITRERTAGVASKVASEESKLAVRESRAKRIIYGFLLLLATLATFASIFVPDHINNVVQIVLALIYLASLKWVSSAFERFASYIVTRIYASDRRYIAGLSDS
jgi:hypothetical protein